MAPGVAGTLDAAQPEDTRRLGGATPPRSSSTIEPVPAQPRRPASKPEFATRFDVAANRTRARSIALRTRELREAACLSGARHDVGPAVDDPEAARVTVFDERRE